MTNDNKDLKTADKKFVVPTTPKTETRIILEQQDLYPDLGYEDVSSQRGYGPMRSIVRATVLRELGREKRERNEKKREQGICIWDNCQNTAEAGDNLCTFHKRERSETRWVVKTVADAAASVFVPGYAATKAVAGAVSWVAGQASGSQSASDFGGNAIKDEIKSEAWDAAATVASGSSKFGGNYSAGVGMASSLLDWTIHQNHVDRGENYRSDCPICRN